MAAEKIEFSDANRFALIAHEEIAREWSEQRGAL